MFFGAYNISFIKIWLAYGCRNTLLGLYAVVRIDFPSYLLLRGIPQIYTSTSAHSNQNRMESIKLMKLGFHNKKSHSNVLRNAWLPKVNSSSLLSSKRMVYHFLMTT